MAEVRTIIPEQLFVGLGHQLRDSHPHAALTSWGTDVASKSRMQTVQNYSKHTWCIDNSPQWGMRIGDVCYKEAVYIQDPRGFSVSVAIGHITELMKTCTIVDSVIQAPCVWSRRSGDNVLLTVGSEAHDLATIQTRVANSKVSIKQVSLGDWVTLTNGTQGVYLGKFHTMVFDTSVNVRYINSMGNRLSVDNTVKMVLWQPHMKRGWMPYHNQALLFLSNPVVAEHTKHDHTYTDAQAEIKVNELLNDPTCYVIRNTRSYNWGRVLFATRKPPVLDNLIIQPEPTMCTNEEEVHALRHKMHYSENGTDFWVWGGQSRNNVVTVVAWDSASLQQNQLQLTAIKNQGYHQVKAKPVPVNQVLSNLYVMKSTYVSSLGNTLQACI